jgi:hypothetical protein
VYRAIGSPALSHTARKGLSTAEVLSLGQSWAYSRRLVASSIAAINVCRSSGRSVSHP